MPCNTGHGAVLIFKDDDGTTVLAWSPEYRSIDGWSMSRPVLDTSHLGTDKVRTNCPGDLYEMGGFAADLLYDPGNAINDYNDILFDGSVARDKGPVELYLPNGQVEKFDGYVTDFSKQEVATDVLMAANITVQVSGLVTTEAGTPPA